MSRRTQRHAHRPGVVVALLLTGGMVFADDEGAGVAEIDTNAAEEAHAAEQEATEATEAAESRLADDIFLDSRDCINTTRIRRTDVLGNQAVLFYLSGSEIYLNRLPHKCNGLRMADAFSYEVRTSQLCHVDVIRVVRYYGGSLSPGVACGLGKFQAITEEQLLVLKERGFEED